METKTTDELKHEIQAATDIQDYRELYARDERDAVILFALQRGQTILEANELLFDQGFGTLGVPEELNR